MIKVIATFIVKSDTSDRFIELATEMISLTRKEQGCAQYDLVQSIEKPERLTILEGWESQEDLDAHSASEHFARLVPQLCDLCIEPPSIDANLLIV